MSLAEVLDAAEKADVVFLGETHDDPVAHQVELFVLASLQERRPCALSLEMFEADVQGVVDEYLAGLIPEPHFLSDARPWVNYGTDYRLLVEFAKFAGLPVAAANVPRRYVGAVGRDGLAALEQQWPSSSNGWVPPRPIPQPSDAYMKHLNDAPAVPVHARELGIVDDKCPFMRRPNELMHAVVLWDVAMAFSVAKQLSSFPHRAIVHVCGVFHVERSLGICEMLPHYRKNCRQLVVAMYPEEDCHTFNVQRHGGTGDFVVLTDASLPRSYDHHGA